MQDNIAKMHIWRKQ